MIQLDDVTYRYDEMEMRFSLVVRREVFLAIIGPSGAGKSTLLHLLAGFEQPISGRILIEGCDMAGKPPALRPLSMIFQEGNVFDHLTIRSNVALGISPRLTLSADDEQQVTQALERCGLGDLAQRKPTQVSGGERQRIAIARALVRKQPVLIMDEPFTSLGPALRAEMLQLILDLKLERGLTVLMVTHQPEDIQTVADETAFIENGTVQAVMPTSRFFSAAAPSAIKSYLGRTPA